MYTDKEIPYNFYNNKTAKQAFSLIKSHNDGIIDRFYQQLINNSKTSEFLTHSDIESRLKNSFRKWLMYTFNSNKVLNDLNKFYAYQDNIGRVHSRVNIALNLINYSKVVLKRCIFDFLDKDSSDSSSLACYISDVVDYSVDMFNQSYLNEMIETTRHRQSLKLVSSGHQLALDFERAKGEITAWTRDIVWNISQKNTEQHKQVDQLNIYHWLKHKGSFTFTDEKSGELLIKHLDELNEVEVTLNRKLKKSDSDARTSSISKLLQSAIKISEIICVELDNTIQLILDAEERNDALTKTLSRRYLPAIAQREVLYAKHSGTPFSVLMIDIDDFKMINDTYGHRVGDKVLEDMAQILMERVRPGDYVFRYGGEEFLVIISETRLDVAGHIAEDIRRQIAKSLFLSEEVGDLQFSVSIGAAEYDFQPDFIHTVGLADKHLYTAKNSGKNCVVIR